MNTSIQQINTSIEQGCIELIKSDNKHIYNIANDFYFKWMLLFSTFYLSKNPEKMIHTFPQNIKQHNCFQHW